MKTPDVTYWERVNHVKFHTQQLLLAHIYVTHYEGKTNCTTLKEISNISEYKIREAMIEHEANEDKAHFLQCRTVPGQINNEIHGVHLEPCYKIFTRILADKKNEEETQWRCSSRLSSTFFINSNVPKLFNDKCFLCKKERVQRNNQERSPVTIATDKAVESFLAAAKDKDPSIYQELLLLDLYAKEFKRHEHCHLDFTCGFTKSRRNKQVMEPKISSCIPLNTLDEKL